MDNAECLDLIEKVRSVIMPELVARCLPPLHLETVLVSKHWCLSLIETGPVGTSE